MISSLVFGGGGTRCLIYAQALAELQTKGMLGSVRKVWGTSAGALIGTMFALSNDGRTVRDALYKCDFSRFRDIAIKNILNINETWGLDDGNNLRRMIGELCNSMRGGGAEMKMSDLPTMNIVVADLSIRETIVINAETYPELPVVDAIRASMSLPLLLRPFVAPSGNIWIDGGLRENFPWRMLSNEEKLGALGFAIEKDSPKTPRTMADFMFSMVHYDEIRNINNIKANWPNIIWFPSPPFPTWFTKIKEEDYTMLSEQSLVALTSYLERLPENDGIPDMSALHCTPLSAGPEGRTIESSDNPSPFHAQVQDSSQHQSPCKRPSQRRWSV